ncbi:hypothetical protein WJX72_007178 [[Myrmecia] bisecta]|uniref:K Homology domain-containing protein n=1 Tax=[Myrmecia] bisecta TaxID=41462 RepID=A0AAW1Q3Q1_9CHLO
MGPEICLRRSLSSVRPTLRLQRCNLRGPDLALSDQVTSSETETEETLHEDAQTASDGSAGDRARQDNTASTSRLDDPNFTRARVLVGDKLGGFVIGVKGQLKKKLRHETGANAVVTSRDRPVMVKNRKRRILAISGTVEQITDAVRMIYAKAVQKEETAKLLEIAPGKLGLVLLLPAKVCGRVIGEKGTVIRRTAEVSGAKLNITNALVDTRISRDRTLYIQGQPTNIVAALGLVLEEVRELEPYKKTVRSVDNGVRSDGAAAPKNFPPTFLKTTGRVVAIGDIHGDIQKALRALHMAGVLEEEGGRALWVGGNTIVVQLGDIMDRGDTEIGVLMLLRELDRQAKDKGGAVYMLNGNHESLNVVGDFRYATAGGMRESAKAAGLPPQHVDKQPLQVRARLQLFAPGGLMAKEFAKNPTILVINDTVFAHGGVLPVHVKYGLERINREVSQWMQGYRMEDGSRMQPPYLAMGDASSVMWNRAFSKEKFATPHERYVISLQLKQTLQMIDAKQLVIGHTPQLVGANSECEGKVWRMDVGMSSGVLDAAPQVLEILPGENGESISRLVGQASGSRRQVGAFLLTHVQR